MNCYARTTDQLLGSIQYVSFQSFESLSSQQKALLGFYPEGGEGVLPYKGLIGTYGQPGYVFRDFYLKQGIEFINFCLKQGIFLNSFVIANGLNKEFRYLLLPYRGMVSG